MLLCSYVWTFRERRRSEPRKRRQTSTTKTTLKAGCSKQRADPVMAGLRDDRERVAGHDALHALEMLALAVLLARDAAHGHSDGLAGHG